MLLAKFLPHHFLGKQLPRFLGCLELDGLSLKAFCLLALRFPKLNVWEVVKVEPLRVVAGYSFPLYSRVRLTFKSNESNAHLGICKLIVELLV